MVSTPEALKAIQNEVISLERQMAEHQRQTLEIGKRLKLKSEELQRKSIETQKEMMRKTEEVQKMSQALSSKQVVA